MDRWRWINAFRRKRLIYIILCPRMNEYYVLILEDANGRSHKRTFEAKDPNEALRIACAISAVLPVDWKTVTVVKSMVKQEDPRYELRLLGKGKAINGVVNLNLDSTIPSLR